MSASFLSQFTFAFVFPPEVQHHCIFAMIHVVVIFTWLLRKHKCLLVSNQTADGFRSSPRDLVMRINALPKGTSASTWFRTRVTGLRDHCSTNFNSCQCNYTIFLKIHFLLFNNLCHFPFLPLRCGQLCVCILLSSCDLLTWCSLVTGYSLPAMSPTRVLNLYNSADIPCMQGNNLFIPHIIMYM